MPFESQANPALDDADPKSESASDLREVGHKLLQDSLAPVQDDLTGLENALVELVPAETQAAQDVLRHVFSAGGKRVRPALFFFCCKLTGYRGPHYFPIASVCEYVHTASLLHDDVVDNSTLRRNKPTSNSIWGDETSVLVGDLIYARASELMAASGSLAIVETFAKAIRLMSEGELYQLNAVFDADVSIDQYLTIVNRKTAVLISASCKAAGILAGVSDKQQHALSRFGEAVGTAFQLVDDALDYLGSREVFGKPTRSDLLEGKITLPVILLKEHMSASEEKKLRQIINTQPIRAEQVDYVAELIEKYDTAEATIAKANAYTDSALAALEAFPASAERQALATLAERLVWRFN